MELSELYAALILLLTASVRVATPVLFASLGGCLSEQAGVFAMGLEGYMMTGAFVAVVAVTTTGSLALGVVLGVLAAVLVALILAVATVTAGAEQVLSGLALNFLVIGATAFLFKVFWGQSGMPLTPRIDLWPIPVLSRLPLLGPVFFNQPPLNYLAYLTIPLAWWFLYRTHWGLQLRAVGEKPRAADTVGINVHGMRYLAVALSGALAGFGGVVLSLQQVNTFTENMVAGRGWLGLIAAIFGRWNPLGAAAASFLFGVTDALQLRVQISQLQVSSWFVLMIPHVLALLLIAAVGRAARHPAATGVHYTKE
jgi:simple sugar transport system permease protein